MKRILFVAKLTSGTGNHTTACRVVAILQELGFYVDISDGVDVNDLTGYDLVIALHALHFSKLLESLVCPYIVILGGTDVNCSIGNAEKLVAIDNILAKSTHTVSFNETMKGIVLTALPHMHASKITVIPQSSDTTHDNEDGQRSGRTAAWRSRLGYSADDFLVLLPAGLRAVKAPHLVLPNFIEWHAQDSKVHLLLVGPVLELEYLHRQASIFCGCVSTQDCVASGSCTVVSPRYEKSQHQAVKVHQLVPIDENFTRCICGNCRYGGVAYLSAIARDDFLQLLTEVDVVLNSSESEGMCGAILEAMGLGVPVVARSITGNSDLIEHMESGWLFDTPEECVSVCHSLYTKRALSTEFGSIQISWNDEVYRVICNAKHIVHSKHSFKVEKAAYAKLLRGVLDFM